MVVASTEEEPSANEVARKYWYYWPSEREQTSRAKREAVEQVVIFGAQKSAKKCGCLRYMVRLDESVNVARDDEHSTPITHCRLVNERPLVLGQSPGLLTIDYVWLYHTLQALSPFEVE